MQDFQQKYAELWGVLDALEVDPDVAHNWPRLRNLIRDALTQERDDCEHYRSMVQGGAPENQTPRTFRKVFQMIRDRIKELRRVRVS